MLAHSLCSSCSTKCSTAGDHAMPAHLQVVTAIRQWADKDSPLIGQGFDQEAAAAVVARHALCKRARKPALRVTAMSPKSTCMHTCREVP